MVNQLTSLLTARPIALLVTVLAFISCGCASQSHSSKSTGPVGSITVKGNTPRQIAEMVANVFVEDGFLVASKKTDLLVFEKPGGTWNDIAYGSWSGAHVWRRVKVTITHAPEDSYWLECTAYNVRDRGDMLEEEVKFYRTGQYIKMLDQAAMRLKKE